jgi:hypothetical protein
MTAIVLGGAAIDAYPVPAPRPYRPSLASEAEMERYQLRPGFDVPVPASRPESG